MAYRRMAARLRPPTPIEILAGMHVPSPEALALRLADPIRGLAANDRAGVAPALERFFPGEAERLTLRADRVLAGRLTIFGRELDVARPGGGTDWQREPLSGARFDAQARFDPAATPPGAEVKACWAVGRGDAWVALACGAAADPGRADRYAEAYVASVRDFVAQNPVDRGVQWGCAMEAGLRAVCLGQAHAMLSGRPALADPGYALDLAKLAVATGRFVLARLEDSQAVPNNHLAADWVGLLACAALLPEWPEASRWRALGRAGLIRTLAEQTHPEGTTFEGSVPYHRLALELFTAGALLARRLHAPLGQAFWDRLAAMYGAARALLGPGGELPQIGDDDSGRVFAFCDRPALDGGYLLPLGAAITGNPELRVRPGAAGGEEVLWLFGAPALERLARAGAGRPPRSASFPQGGFHVLRRGRLEVALSCGLNGQRGVGGHSHNDKLAFELRVDGRLAVCDPGSPSYTAEPALRTRFRSTQSHATLCVQGQEQAPIAPERPFALPDAARARCLAFQSTRRLERFVGEHRGYLKLGLVHRREALLFDDALVIADRLEGLGDGAAHDVALRFPFPIPEARVRAVLPAERLRLQAIPELRGVAFDLASAVEIGPQAAPLALLVVASPTPLVLRLEESDYSPGYGQLVRSRTASLEGRLTSQARLVSAFLPLGRTV
jgi:hypothetical protein